MKLIVEEAAARWYRQEMDLSEHACLRIYVRMGGCGSVHPGLSLGIMEDVPRNPGLSTTVAGIQFYMEEDNLWYIGENELHLTYHAERDESLMVVHDLSV